MKISIITVSYNSDQTISDTIKSVLIQSYKNIEYIVIDGLSNDNTIKIIKEYESKFEGKLKWISEKDNGIYDAMNKGITMASGDIIGILNSDDFFTSPFIIESIAKVLNNNKNIDAIYGDVHFVKSEDISQCVRYYSSKIFRRSLMRIGLIPAHPTFYCKKECFLKYGLYKSNYAICADFDLLLRFVYINNISIKYIQLDMVAMRAGGASTNGIKSHITIMKEHLRSFKENHLYTNALILSLRYLYKLMEFAIYRQPKPPTVIKQ